MAAGIFVTGTDTSVGKTVVSCAIARALVLRGINVGVYKPAETGARRGGSGQLVGDDCGQLAAAAGGHQSANEVATYLYETPAAPLVAAEKEGQPLDLERIYAHFRQLGEKNDFLLVEGAGGIYVPLTESTVFLEVAKAMGLPVVVIVGCKLGCINHALLTLEALERAEVPIAGYVVNYLQGDPNYQVAFDTNRTTIARFTKQRDLGAFPSVGSTGADYGNALAQVAETHLDLDAIVEASGYKVPEPKSLFSEPNDAGSAQ